MAARKGARQSNTPQNFEQDQEQEQDNMHELLLRKIEELERSIKTISDASQPPSP